MIDKFYGVIAGLACGDALGAPTEFLRYAEIVKRYGPTGITQLPDPAMFTDDTQMTVALALGLLDAAQEAAKTNATPVGVRAAVNQPAFVMPYVARRFAEWSISPENNRAPGNTCMAACRQLRAGVPWSRAGVEGSKGCGAAMRVAPIGLLYSDFVALGRIARASALSTHGHPVAAQAAHAAALAVRLLALGFNPESLVGTLIFELEMNGGIDDGFKMLLGRIEHAIRLTLRGVKAPEEIQVPVETHPEALGVAWVADEAVACALYCFLLAHARDEGYVETVRYGANTDGDSDSIACIAGSFAGAHWGMTAPKGVPESWATRVEDAEKLSLIATRLYAVSLLMDNTSTHESASTAAPGSGVVETKTTTGTDTIKE